MAVAIRLKKLGTKNKPVFRIVAVDSRKTRDGASLATLGFYNPCTDPATVKLDLEKIMSFLKTGAQPTEVVRDLLRRNGIIRTASGEWKNSAELQN